MHLRLVFAAILVLVLGVLFALPASAAPTASARQDFIVVLKDSVDRAAPVAAEHSRRFGGEVRYVYEHALKGYAGSFSEGQLGALLADGRVASVERDAEVTAFTTQNGATWGIYRIDQGQLPLSSTFTYTNTGSGVKAYIIDT